MTKRVWMAALLSTLLVGCAASLTPRQTDGLEEAQRFCNEVTRAYRVSEVRVHPNTAERGWIYYNQGLRWITIQPRFLGSEDQPVLLARTLGEVAMGTSGHDTQSVLSINRTTVDIMIRFLGMTERQAIDRLARLFLDVNATFVEYAQSLRLGSRPTAWPVSYLHPCAQLKALWTSYALGDPQPACEPGPGLKL